jgi:hypothetical protein
LALVSCETKDAPVAKTIKVTMVRDAPVLGAGGGLVTGGAGSGSGAAASTVAMLFLSLF